MTSTAFKLGLPTDIPWKRVCVTRDMIDPGVCDDDFPPKWHSSIAIFEYVPAEEFQTYPDYEITYLKVSVTITGYQPRDAEIEGNIDWNALNVQGIDEVESLLNEYHPCTGAILQVGVGPGQKESDLSKFPFILEFEPKKRELFEMATDTNERMSRSLETLNVGKSAQSTQSLEVLDIDMGGSVSFGAEGSYAGTGGGFNFASSNQGQWGTKSVGQNQSTVTRTTDNSQEKREAHSFTTQISQLYHQLDSYHLGTNRAIFFVQPRPHVLEVPSGFVRGPRSVEGIQEFFLVVANPKGEEDFCVSARLDTAHLATIDIMDYDYMKDSFSLSTSVGPPDKNDPGAVHTGFRYIDVKFIKKIGERRYKCYTKTVSDEMVYIPPFAQYQIDVADNGGYEIQSQSSSHGTHSITVQSDGSSLHAKVTASGHRCYDDGGTVCVNCPDHIGSYSGNSSLSLLVNLISKEPIKKVGTEQVLIVTTRGLCCCPHTRLVVASRPSTGVMGAIPIGALVESKGKRYGLAVSDIADVFGGDDKESTDREEAVGSAAGGRHTMRSVRLAQKRSMTPQQANSLAELLRDELRAISASMSPERRQVVPYVLSDFFALQVEQRFRVHARPGIGERRLGEEAIRNVDRKRMSEYFGRSHEEVTGRDIAGLSLGELCKATGLEPIEAGMLRLNAIGLRLKRPPGQGSGDEPEEGSAAEEPLR